MYDIYIIKFLSMNIVLTIFFLLLQVDKILDVRLTQPGKLLGKNMINLVVWI